MMRDAGAGAWFWLSIGWLVLVVGLAVTAPVLPLPGPAEPDFTAVAQAPGAVHWLGTDALGRDLLSRSIVGARVSLVVGLLAPAIGGVAGLALGLCAGYFRGRIEALIVAAMDAILAFPGILLALAVTAFVGAQVPVLVLLLGILSIPAFTRVARAATLTFAQREFVLAARALGATPLRVLTHELLPNVTLPVLVYALQVVARMIVIEGVLSFLGLSVPPPAPTWGNMIADGQADLANAPHIVFIPSALLCATVLALHAIGERLRARADPGGGPL